MRSFRPIEDFLRDVAFGVRLLVRSPVFSLVAILSLALAIGANTAIFSLLNELVFRDLPVRDAARLVQFHWTYPGDPPLNRFSVESYETYRDRNTVFSDMLGSASVRLDVQTAGIGAQTLDVACVTGNLFTALGVGSATGRLLEASDNQPGASPAAVVSWAYWNEKFNRRPDILGTAMTLADMPVTVVGVAARDFSGLVVGYRPDVWIPTAVCERKARVGLALMARLKEGVSIDRAQAEMRVLDRPRIDGFAERDPKWRETTFDVSSARAGLSTPVHQQFVRPLWAVMALVGALLLLACANVGSLLVARGAARQREIALRVSLGAGRLRILRQVLAESLLLALAGGVVGIAAAYAGARVLLRVMTSGTRMLGVPPQLDVRLDVSVLIFTFAVMALAALLFGLAPAVAALTSAPASSLHGARGSGQSRSGKILGNSLVVAQVALSVVLLSVSALYAGHLSHLRDSTLGFDRTSVLLASLDMSRSGQSRDVLAQRYKELLDRFRSLPGVQSATLSGMTPISGAAGSRFVTAEGFEDAPETRYRVQLNDVAPHYFETLHTPLVAGRDFQFADEGRSRVAIVNQATARYYFEGRDPLGKHIRFDADVQPYEIVGVVADAKYSDVRVPAPRTIYVHAFQQRRIPSNFALRTTGPATAIAADVRRIVGEVFATAPEVKMTTLAEQVDSSIVPERLMAALAGFFGGAGMLLAALGLYGLLAYTVARRTHEIGVRMALGAQQHNVIAIVLRRALTLVGAGLVIGVPLALWSERVAASIVGSLSPRSLVPVAIALVATVAVAFVAAYVPARRATRVDPLTALRSE